MHRFRVLEHEYMFFDGLTMEQSGELVLSVKAKCPGLGDLGKIFFGGEK